MPELPEVETLKIGLSKKILGLSIKNIEILNQSSFIGNPEDLRGKKILNLWRRGKVLGIDLSQKISILIHLKMSGQLILIDDLKSRSQRIVGGHPTLDMHSSMPNRATRVVFILNNGSKIYFNDQRKFGWVKALKHPEIKNQKFLSSLGPEPLEVDFSWEILKHRLSAHKTLPIKVALMDQKIIAGVGNIYASEACFIARVDPRTRTKDITDKQFQALFQGVQEALQKGIYHGGSSRAHFVNSEGGRGYFLDFAYVYEKRGQPCMICKTRIEKIVLGGRGTYFCPNCQR